MVLDQFGREIKTIDRRRPVSDEIYVAQIRDRWSRYPSSGLTPERLTQILREADNGDLARQAELFEEMEEKDPHIASQLQTRKLAVQGLEYEILPASEDPRDQKIADFCNEVLAALPAWEDHVLDLMDAISKGYSVLEVVWEVAPSGVRVKDLRWVHPKRVTFWDSMTPRILTETEPGRGEDPPPFKILYHRYKARSGHDSRAGVLRVCAWMYLFKNYVLKDWVSFAEAYGMPLRVGKYEPGSTDADRKALLAAIASLGSDASAIISSNTAIEFVEAQRAGSGNITVYDGLVAFCDAQVSKAILGQTLTSEAGGSKGQGSFALGNVHNAVRQDLAQADSLALSRTLNQQLLRPLVGFNFGWDAPVPRLRFLSTAPEDLEMLSRVYGSLRKDLNLPMSREHVSKRFNIPLPQPGETLLEAFVAGTAAEVPAGEIPPGEPAPRAAKLLPGKSGYGVCRICGGRAGQEGSPPDTATRIADKAAEGAAPLWDDLIAPARNLVMTAGSLDEIRDRLLDLYADMDPRDLGALMAQAMLLADQAGRFEVRSGD